MPGSPGAAVQLPPKNWAYLQDMVNWMNNPSTWLYGRWNQPASAAEGGVDFFSPAGTPVFALGNGQVVAKGYNNVDGKGVVTVRTDVPGYGKEDLYYQHIDLNSMVNLNPGAPVVYGEQLGSVTDKGANSHVELGFNSGWGGPWGSNHPDKWYTDPRPLLKALINQHPNPTVVNPNGTPVAANTGLNANAVASGSCNPWDFGCLFGQVHDQLVSFAEHIAIFVLALVLIAIGFFLLAETQAMQIAGKVVP